MLYNVYEQHAPKKRDNRNEWDADVRFVKTLDIPIDKDPIEFAKIKCEISHPLVSKFTKE